MVSFGLSLLLTTATVTLPGKSKTKDGYSSSLAREADTIPPSRRLVEILVDRSAQILAKLERPAESQVSSLECFKLWSYLGELESKDETRLYSTWVSLKSRLITLIGTRRNQLIACLEEGIQEILRKIKVERQRTAGFFSKNSLGSKLTSYEFNDGLLGLRDQLGYVQLLTSSLNSTLPRHLVDRIESEDKALKDLLPRAIEQFRENNDDPTPFPERFPESFWWRHI